jgi:hypothetical protein
MIDETIVIDASSTLWKCCSVGGKPWEFPPVVGRLNPNVTTAKHLYMRDHWIGEEGFARRDVLIFRNPMQRGMPTIMVGACTLSETFDSCCPVNRCTPFVALKGSTPSVSVKRGAPVVASHLRRRLIAGGL